MECLDSAASFWLRFCSMEYSAKNRYSSRYQNDVEREKHDQIYMLGEVMMMMIK